MKKKAIWILAAALCAGAFLGWRMYDANVDHSGWETKDQGTYYKDFSGSYVSGWQEIEGKRYYFHETQEPKNAMATGWVDLEDGRYYMDEDGVMVTGWQEIDGNTFFFGQDGAMATGWVIRDGVRCYLGSDGILASGWIEEGGMRYYLNESGTPVSGWQEISGERYYFQENGVMLTGWAQFEGVRYYFGEDGVMVTGWQDIGESRCCFDESGAMVTGWLEQDGNSYYLKSDGAMAVGPTEIEGAMYYFSPKGVHVLLVNPWNALPEGYSADLLWVNGGPYRVDSSCYDALVQMLADCKAAGHDPVLASAYRTQDDQIFLFNRKVNYYLGQGLEEDEAKVEAAKVIAVPGTSEHQLGLAVDIVDAKYTAMTDAQADTATQQWLMEHCHEYGFILRYPAGTTDITGIIYEPWHYRYVGVEIAQEIRELGVTLEEYLGAADHE